MTQPKTNEETKLLEKVLSKYHIKEAEVNKWWINVVRDMENEARASERELIFGNYAGKSALDLKMAVDAKVEEARNSTLAEVVEGLKIQILEVEKIRDKITK